MVFYRVNLEDDKAFGEQVELLVGVQQKVVFAAFVVRFQYIEEIGDVEILFPHLLGLQYASVFVPHKLIEGIERGHQAAIRFQLLDIEADGI